MTKWKNVAGSMTLTLSQNHDEHNRSTWYDDNGNDLPDELRHELTTLFPNEEFVEMDIMFLSSGYDTPGTWYRRNGDPGDPPEHEDERVLDRITVNGTNLTKETADIVFEHYNERIQEVEVDTSGDDYGD